MKYIYYSSANTFDATSFDAETVRSFECRFKGDRNRLWHSQPPYACFNSSGWIFKLKTVMLVQSSILTASSLIIFFI